MRIQQNNVSNTLASYSTGVNPMAPPNNQSSMEPTTVPMLEESPIPPDSVGPSNQLPVYADGMLNDASQMYWTLVKLYPFVP